MSNEARIIKVVAEYYSANLNDVQIDTMLSSLTDHRIDPLDVHEIVGDVEKVFEREPFDHGAYPVASQTLTVRDFLRMVEPEGDVSRETQTVSS